MPGHVLFVRFFKFIEPFPFGRFFRVSDDGLGNAAESLRREWWRSPANRARYRKYEIDRQKRIRQWEQGALARPGINWLVAAPAPSAANQNRQPSLQEIAEAAGWHGSALGDWPLGISCRYPIAHFDEKKRADVAAAVLQERVKELAQSAYTRTDSGDEDLILASANPRFFVVAEADLSDAEQATVREKIDRLDSPTPGIATQEEVLLRFYMPKLHTFLRTEAPRPPEPKGGRPRSHEVEEVQAYVYKRWIKGHKLAAIRQGAVSKFGEDRAPQEDAHVTQAAKRYAKKHGLPTARPKSR
jgi:hypothetical protein